jgi:hypothetical protein
VQGDVKPVIAVGKQITVMIAMCHVMLAVPVVLGCHFVLSTTKQMKDLKRQTVGGHALNGQGDVNQVQHSSVAWKEPILVVLIKFIQTNPPPEESL